MERPKTNSKKISWFSIASVFMLAIALAVGAASNAQAATGSFDRDNYLPSLSDTNDYDRAWFTVTDSSITTAGTDSITVSVKSGANSVAFVLKETGSTSTVFTTTGNTQPGQIGVGTNTGYVPDFQGSYLYPALGASTTGTTLGVTALNLKAFVTQNGGDATIPSDGNLNVVSGDTLQLLYGGSTLDTAVIGFNGANNSTITFTQGSAWGNSSTQPAANESVNVIVSVSDPDVNLNPKMKDCIGLKDGFTPGLTATATSRVQVEAIDQNTGITFILGGTSTVARNIMLVETGANTGVFTAQGKIYGTATADILRGNIYINSGTSTESFRGGTSTNNYAYSGNSITLGSATTNLSSPANTDIAVSFKILEITASGRIGLIFAGSSTGSNGFGTATLAYQASTDTFTGSTIGSSTNWSGTKVVAVGTNTTAFGSPVTAGNTGSGTSIATGAGLLKLIDGNNYCLVVIGTYTAGNGTATNNGLTGMAMGEAYSQTGAGSITVNIDSFMLFGPRNGDTIKVSYLDALNSGGSVGTVTSVSTFGVTGETGALSADKTTADINDFLVVTVVDGNLNTTASSKETVIGGTSLYSGTATTSSANAISRGDRLTVAAYSRTGSPGIGTNTVHLSHPDGSKIGTQTIRISNTDNSLVWMVPTTLTYVGGFGDPLTFGTSSFSLGTQSSSTIPLIKGTTGTADSFLNSATTLSFVATTDAADNTVEISPDGTHWVAVPVVETGVNSSTFIGTVGFDCTAARITTSTTRTAAATFSDFTGTSSITFSSEGGNITLNSSIGTGSVVMVSDGTFREFKEVTGVSGSVLSVEKLSNSSFYTPWKTWVQVVGNDLDNNRLDTLSAGSVVFRIGGYYGATYRVRYNDALGASNAYRGGDTLAATTSNVAFQTNTGVLTVSPSGTVGLNSQIEVVLVDDDLNVSTVTANATFANLTTTFLNLNEAGLGNPSGTSTGNTIFRNGVIAKQILVSRATSVTSTSFADASNTVTVTLTETGVNSGTFKGTYKLSSGSSTTGAEAPPTLKVSNGDTITVFYNDSPSATAENNLSSYTTVSMLGQGGLGTLSLSKSEAFLSGDSVVITLNDNDQNTTNSIDSASVKYKSSSDAATTGPISLTETAANSGIFTGTLRTSTTSSATTTPPTVRAVAAGTVTVTYADASPAADVTAAFSTKNYGAVLAFDADAVALGSSIGVSLYDPETNTAITQADLVNISIKSTTDSSGTTLRLTETGKDTGSFLGTIAASSDSSLLNTRIKAATGDTLTATFTDSPNASASISTVTDTATVGVAVATPTPTPGPATPTPTPGPATPTPTPGPTPTTGVIIGTVSTGGVPIPGATVSTDTGGFTATTGPDGTYTIAEVTAGAYTVTASAAGFDSASQTVTVTAGSAAVADFDLVPSTPPTPTVTPTPTAVCEPEAISVSPTSLTLKRNKSGDVTVTVTGADDCAVEGETVTATINSAGKKRISVSPTSDSTDENGQATFTITAKKKTGSARVTFKAGAVKKSMTVKVRK